VFPMGLWEDLSASSWQWHNNIPMHLEKTRSFLLALAGILIASGLIVAALAEPKPSVFLPALFRPEKNQEPVQEVRALWVTRFDWMSTGEADPAKIDELVANAASARFNTIYFQVRAEADAYYDSDVEPWSRRLTGELGKDPGWDPLARLIRLAHARGLQVHAYMNVYPLWTGCDVPPDNSTPRHLYHLLREYHGTTDGKLNGAQWSPNNAVYCLPYFRVSPASIMFDNHLVTVVKDLVQKYDVDGIHLDQIRYAGEQASCDPVSKDRFGEECFESPEYKDWQRQQINGTVEKLYKELTAVKPQLWLTAAVWPVYQDIYGWGVKSAYDTYYQDPKAWLSGGYIDGVSPMIYTGSPNCDSPYFWTRERWTALVADYQADSGGRYVIPGIGVNYCTDNDFVEIEARIELARAQGTAGHAIFSYSSLLRNEYFDDLAEGPYSEPASVGPLPWH
jgi:uncharacterized lipoprotein YddW (UPF0748 family)